LSAFAYQQGQLHAEDVPLDEIAAAVGTPFYCYSSAAVEDAFRAYAEALDGLDATICYALKANANLSLVRSLARLGAGADVVSEGELRCALAAEVPAEKIVFAGVGKTEREMVAGLEAGILQVSVESLPELEALNRIARERGTRAPVALRINPDVDALTHQKISTGKAENKFGIDLAHARAAFEKAAAMPGIALEGLAVHIGSQLTDLRPFRNAFGRVIALFAELRASGLPLSRLDLGGGLGIAYDDAPPPDVAAYGAMVREMTAGLGAHIMVEPGRSLVGNAGLLVTRLLYVKEGAQRRFLVVDAAMNDLIRPSMYDAWHRILPVAEPAPGAASHPADIVGPICETADTFARQRPMPPLAAGALLAICSTGAYGAAMASSYNARLLAPEVLVRGGDFAVVRPRPDYAALLCQDHMAPWLAERPARKARGAA
jgi:diaminopimelate decarboxylase